MNKLFFSDIDILYSREHWCDGVGGTTYSNNVQYIMNKLRGGVPPEDVVTLVEHLLYIINKQCQDAHDYYVSEMDIISANNEMEDAFYDVENTIKESECDSYTKDSVLDIMSELRKEIGYSTV